MLMNELMLIYVHKRHKLNLSSMQQENLLHILFLNMQPHAEGKSRS